MTVRKRITALLPRVLRRAAHPGRAVRAGTASARPLLSLILVPADPTEPKGDARTLPSLLAQTYEPLEILVAGTSASSPVLRELAGADPRVRFLSPEFSLSEAVRTAGGDAVALVESGSVVPEGYYAKLLPGLLESSTDFVSGLHPRPRSAAGREAARLGSAERMNLTLGSLPSAFADTRLWPKLLARPFLDSALDGLPAAASSQQIVARVLREAKCFGYVPVNVPEPEIQGADENAPELLQRLTAAWQQLAEEAAYAPADALGHWMGEFFGARWALLSREVPRQESSYWKSLSEAASALAAEPSALDRFSVHDRVLAVLAAAGRLDDFRLVLAELQDGGRGYRVHDDGSELVARPVYLDLLASPVPENVLRLSDADFPVRSRLRTFEWGPGGLRLGGFAYVPGMGGEHHPGVQVFLADPETGVRVAVETETVQSAAINETTGDRWNDYSGAGFSAVVGRSALEGIAGADRTVWFVEVHVAFHGRTAVGRLTNRDSDYVPSRLPVGESAEGRRMVAQFDQIQGLRLRTLTYSYVAAHPQVLGTNLALSFVGPQPSRVVLEASGRRTLACERGPGGVFLLPVDALTALDGGAALYQVKAGGQGNLAPVGVAAGSDGLMDLPGIRPGVTGFGYLTVGSLDAYVEVSEWCLEADSLSVRLTGPGTSDLTAACLLLEGEGGTLTADCLEDLTDDGVRALFPLSRDRWGTGPVFAASGRYRLKLTAPDTGELQALPVAPALAGLAAEAHHQRFRLRTRVLIAGEPFEVTVASPLTELERGAFNQQQLIEAYQKTSDPLTDTVFFETFGGTSSTDSGRAICEALAELRPELRLYWSVADPSVAVPANATAVHRYSPQWYRILGTARYLVNNNTFPVFFRKRPGQVYLQTWHGTPLKRIGFDTPAQRLTPSYLRTLEREPGEWDALLAQSPAAAPLLAGAFRFGGRVPVLGYPRNDALAGDRAAARRRKVRAELQIPEGQTAVLYAPTWRDTARTRTDRQAVVNYLDAGTAHDSLGDGYTILFRGHHNVAGQRTAAGISGLVDVTDYPQISDLCLAADLLVTDYSSIMFDFAVTGKPMFFLVPDLAEYRDSTRGFYFDLGEHAPGPVALKSAELYDEILSYRPEEWAARYTRFVEQFAPCDDGEAASRVVKYIWDGTERWH